VMTGGLARVGADATRRIVSSALGAVAKDVWVLSSETTVLVDPWVSGADDAGRQRVVSGISPRTAENLFWMGRYAERAGDTVRVLRTVVDRWNDYHRSPVSPGGRALAALLDAIGASAPASWTRAVPADATTDAAVTDAALTDAALTDAATPDLRALLLDRARPGTVAWSVRALAEAAAAVRDQLSSDTWLPIASMERALAGERRALARTAAAAAQAAGAGLWNDADADETAGMPPVLDRLLEALLAVAGIGAESMVRDAGWRFLDAGRRLERAQHVVDTLAATLVETRPVGVDELVLESVLLAHESVITYRRRNQGRASVATVLDLLLIDATNPRSLAYQLDRLREDLAAVPTTLRPRDVRDRLLQDVADVLTELDTVTLAGAVTEVGRRERLAEALESVGWRLRSAAEEIALLHFAHPVPSRTFADTWGVESSASADDDTADGPPTGVAEPVV